MATFKKTMLIRALDQAKEETWNDGTGIINEDYIGEFQKSGCFLCAATMVTAYMENNNTMMPSELVTRGAATATSPKITSWSKVSSQFVLKEYTTNMLEKIAEAILIDEVPVFIQVPGKGSNPPHAVAAYGFSGDLPVDPDGNPDCSRATKAMIKFHDPYKGNYSNNLSGLTSAYGEISKVRIPE